MAGPQTYGRRGAGEHDHSGTGEGGSTLTPDSLVNGVAGSGVTVNRLAGAYLGEQTISGESVLEITDEITSDYDTYVILLTNGDNIGNTQLQMQFTADDGSTWLNAADDYRWGAFRVKDNGGTSSGGSTGDSSFRVSGPSTVINRIRGVKITVYDRGARGTPNISYEGSVSESPDNHSVTGSGRLTSSTAVNGMRFFSGSGPGTGSIDLTARVLGVSG